MPRAHAERFQPNVGMKGICMQHNRNPATVSGQGCGINIDDVPHLSRLGNQELTALGFLDVTAAPFGADPTGETDSTIAIADAVFFARNHKLVAFFPKGDYLVSDTIRCEGGWSDLRTTNHKYFPYCELWGCVLMGDQQSNGRVRIILAESAEGFDNPEQPKPVVDYIARLWCRSTPTSRIEDRSGATGMNQSLIGIDIVIRPGNPGAAAVSFDAAEGSTIQDCTFELGDAYTGILGGPGSGGAVYGLTVHGGRIGAALCSPRPPCTLVGCRFDGAREAAIDYSQRGTLSLVGCEFSLGRGVPALRVLPGPPTRLSSASVIDCRIEYPAGRDSTTAIASAGSVYLRDTWLKNADVACQSSDHGLIGKTGSGWVHVLEAAVPARYHKPIVANIHVDGVQHEQPLITAHSGDAPPVDLRTRHIWQEESFPCWNSPEVVNVRADYGAVGDGETDDTEALQSAIDKHDLLFLPRGTYRVSRTLNLKPNTKLLGVHAPYSMIAPMMTPGGDFNDSGNPQPVLRSASTAQADTQLAWFSVFMPRELARGAYMLDWQCGGSSRLRCVFPITGYTLNDLEPLSKGIYPWHNWSWRDFDFSNATGFVKHYTHPQYAHAQSDKLDSGEETAPDWPMIRVRGFGAGGWYPFMALDGRTHGSDYRRILVEDSQGPLRIYHAHLQYCRGKAEIEIANARNVAIYGIKNEEDAIVVWVHDSQDVLVSGFGGVGKRNPDCKFLIENSKNVVLANLVDDSFCGDGSCRPKPDAHLQQVREIAPDGRVIDTPPYDRIAMYKRT